ILVNKAALFFEIDNIPEAQNLLKEAVLLRPEDPRGLNNLALCYRKQGKNLEAIELFTKNIKAHP
ncbi:MAG: tetratricopeptide repeat protein, partial [Planctomycetia bacterium]